MTTTIQRVPADLALELLRQEGIPLRPASLRNWTRRGHIRRYSDGYDLVEITRYLDQRASR
jgi:hypothetical protein